MNNKLSASDKDWINGFFIGVEAGQEELIEWMIAELKKKRKELKKHNYGN